ncbi:hypothetical protein SPSIL_020080 [Sporomusa silvacetica DSM 10669]|uniref:Tape measure protein N-terminal domain-containing protein n=2 Tax=Sporomusa silvacetica TaxID=55504 RepID=A0ABZ3IJJ7_9FIRM|nr:hypothetical protein SPSIL_23480 [Sporomusa silvacetica DSM 10669]
MVKISANNSGLKKELNASKRQLARFQKDMPDLIPAGASTAMAALGVAMSAAAVKSVSLSAAMEQNKIAFSTMLGSGQAAQKMLDDLATFAEKTPFDFTSLVTSSKKMIGLGYSAEEIIPTLNILGDAVAAVGGNSENMSSIVDAFAKMRAGGMLAADQMNRLTDAGIPAWQMLAKVLNTDVATAMSMAEQKSINANTAISGMMAEMSTRYGGTMKTASATVSGQMSNIQDTATRTMTVVGDQITQAFDLKTKLGSASAEFAKFADSVKSQGLDTVLRNAVPDQAIVLGMTGVVAYSAANFIPTLAKIRIAALESAAAFRIMTAAMGPWGLAITGVTLLGGELYLQSQKTNASLDLMNSTIYDGASRMNLAGDSAGNLSSNLVQVGKAANYATDAMANFNATQKDGRGGSERYDYDIFAERDRLAALAAASTPPEIPSGGGGGDAGSSGVDEAVQAWEDLLNKTKQVTESIEQEWVQTTKTELEQLDIWKKKQIGDLDIIKAEYEANGQDFAAYEDDKAKIAAVYRTRRTKIVQQEARDAIAMYQSVRDGYESVQREMSQLTGSAKLTEDINIKYDDKIKAARDTFNKISQEYETATDAQKKTILSGLDSENAAYQVTEAGRLDLSKATANAITAYGIQKNKELTDNYATCKDIQASIDAAYNASSLTILQEALTKENAIRQSNYDAQKTMMDLYQQASADATLTWAEVMSRTSATAYDGFKSGIADVLSGTESISDAWGEVGNVVRKVVANMVAEYIAGRMAMALFGEKGGTQTMAKSVTQGAATAAAWWPAAIAVSLATFGANSGPAIGGMAAATVAGMAMGTVSGYATGGLLVGPGTGTSDSILMWGSNREYMLNAAATKSIGIGNLNYMNDTGKIPGFKTGGLVTGPSLSSLSRNYTAASPATKHSNTGVTNAGRQQPAMNVNFQVSSIDSKDTNRFFKKNGRNMAQTIANQARMFYSPT